MVMHYNHPERVSDELVDVRLAHYSRPSTNQGQRNYYSTGRVRPAPATEEEIARLRMPTLVLWSDGSGGSGPDGGQRLASLIPGAQFKVLTECGYWGHWEKPDVFNEAVRQFISGEKVT
jgi:pimeloyl-ACP methyl ester carboxylesterase